MSALKVHRCAGEPVVRLSNRWSSDPTKEDEVAQIWRDADPSRGLTDKEILCVTSFGQTIEVRTTPYRYFYAQSVRPQLFSHPLTALAVSGILSCESRLLIGRRADWVSQDPGVLELVPSGSVDAELASDVPKQLDREAAEELGVGENAIFGHRVLGAIEDDDSHVIDLVIQASLQCSLAELVEAHSRLEQPEYSALKAVTSQELRRMIDDDNERISAVSSAIFANFCAAPQ